MTLHLRRKGLRGETVSDRGFLAPLPVFLCFPFHSSIRTASTLFCCFFLCMCLWCGDRTLKALMMQRTPSSVNEPMQPEGGDLSGEKLWSSEGYTSAPGARDRVPSTAESEDVAVQLTPPSPPQEDVDEGEPLVGSTRRRFAILAVFSAFGFINQVQYVAFSTVIRETQDFYSVGSLEVNLLSLIIPLVYVIAVFPGCSLYNRVGLRNGMLVGTGVNALASTLKLISVWAPKYPLLVVAQVLVALGQVLFLGLPTRVAGTWFPLEERTLATSIASLFGFVGMAVGMLYSPRVVSLPDRATKKQWAGLHGSQFGFSMLVLALALLLFKERPSRPPSHTAAIDHVDGSLWKHVKGQLRSKNVLLLTITFGVTTGLLTAVAAVLTQILEPFEIAETKAGILAFAGILGGAGNCGVVGFLVDRFHRYKLSIVVLQGCVAVLLIVVVIAMKTVTSMDAFAVLAYVVVPLLEFLVLPLVPVAMELSVELTYPEPEMVSTTLVLSSMCLFSFIGMIVFSLILGDYPTRSNSFIVILVVLIACFLSTVGSLFIKENLQRLEQETRGLPPSTYKCSSSPPERDADEHDVPENGWSAGNA